MGAQCCKYEEKESDVYLLDTTNCMEESNGASKTEILRLESQNWEDELAAAVVAKAAPDDPASGGLTVEFIDEDGQPVTKVFATTPLGFTFAGPPNLKVKSVKPGGHAEEHSVKKGWLITKIGGKTPEEIGTHQDVGAFFHQTVLSLPDGASNRALIFIKPHAQTPAVRALVEARLKEKHVVISSRGEISSEEIDAKQLIDKHYYAIASKATLVTPDKLPVPAAKFKEKFGEEWADVLAAGNAANALQACTDLGLSAVQLEAEWRKCELAGDVIKFGGGFYCGRMCVDEKTKYVFNAFFMSMRSKFTGSGSSIYYYSVCWRPADLTWSDFRATVLGTTNPAEALTGSIRRQVLEKWKELGLSSAPSVGDNGVHASASPFEGIAERMNWLGQALDTDPFGSALLANGLSAERLKEWGLDPQVALTDGSKGSLFDALEDMDVGKCIDTLCAINETNP